VRIRKGRGERSSWYFSIFLSDANGISYQFLLYLPYGETMAEQNAASGSYNNPYRFNGKEQDAETGLY